MRVLVILALAACCSGQIAAPYPYIGVPAYPLAVKYQGVDAFGQTTFGHQSIDQARHEVRLADGRVVGQFSYIDANGEPAITYFEAGPNGYRVLGSNILPEAPAADLTAPVYNEVGPSPVEDTPEVALARAEFMKLFEEAAAAAAAAPDDVPVAVEAQPEVTLAAEEPEEASVAEPEIKEAPLAAAEETAVDEPATVVAEPAETPAAEEPSVRRKREVSRIPLPYLHAVPTETKHTLETTQLEPVKAATPADTTKLELTKKEHVFTLPGVKYVQPYAEVKPLEYTVLSPQVVPYQAALPLQPLVLPGLSYPTLLAPAPKEE